MMAVNALSLLAKGAANRPKLPSSPLVARISEQGKEGMRRREFYMACRLSEVLVEELSASQLHLQQKKSLIKLYFSMPVSFQVNKSLGVAAEY